QLSLSCIPNKLTVSRNRVLVGFDNSFVAFLNQEHQIRGAYLDPKPVDLADVRSRQGRLNRLRDHRPQCLDLPFELAFVSIGLISIIEGVLPDVSLRQRECNGSLLQRRQARPVMIQIAEVGPAVSLVGLQKSSVGSGFSSFREFSLCFEVEAPKRLQVTCLQSICLCPLADG